MQGGGTRHVAEDEAMNNQPAPSEQPAYKYLLYSPPDCRTPANSVKILGY